MKTQVAMDRCGEYDPATVFAAVSRSIGLLGGMGSFIKPGERVLIKPNLLKGSPPGRAVTTHPEIVRAVIRLVRQAGARALVCDSPGIGDLRKVAERSGILAVIEEEGATLAAFEDAVVLKGRGRFQRFEVALAASRENGKYSGILTPVWTMNHSPACWSNYPRCSNLVSRSWMRSSEWKGTVRAAEIFAGSSWSLPDRTRLP